MNLHDSLEGVLDDSSSSSRSGGRNPDAERERLCWTFTKILGSGQREVPFVEHVFFSLIFLEPLVVWECDPDKFVPAFNHACFDLYPFGLDVLFALNVDLAGDGFSFLEGCFVERDPDLALRVC